MPSDQIKSDLTGNVARFEGLVANPRSAGVAIENLPGIGKVVEDGIRSTEPWSDTSWGLFGPGWDSHPNLLRRIQEARASAITLQRYGTTIPEAKSESYAAAVASNVKDELGKVGGVGEALLAPGQGLLETLRQTKWLAALPALVVVAVVVGVYARARG